MEQPPVADRTNPSAPEARTGVPPTRRDESVVEVLHGHEVADPYRWLEDQTAEEVAAWVDAQQAHTRAHLDALPDRDAIRDRLAEIWDYPKVGVPWRRGERWFQHRNTGLQEQDVLWVADAPDAEGRVLIDPAELSDDGTVSLGALSVSDDGALLAYGISDGGSDWTTWRVRDVATGEDLPDEVPWGKFSGAAWAPDGSGFYYGGFDPPAPGQELAESNRFHKLRFHRLGTDPADDPVVCRNDEEPEWGFIPAVTEDGRWLVVMVTVGTDPRNMLHLARLDGRPEEVEVRPWIDELVAEHHVIGSDGDTLFVQTDHDAPTGRVLAIDALDATSRDDRIPERPDTPLLFAERIGGRFVVVRARDAVHRLFVHDADGTEQGTVVLPDLASVGGLSGREDDPQALLSVSSLTRSGSILRLDVTDRSLVEVRPPSREVPGAVTEQVLVDSTDGAQVPLFLVRPADASRDGTLPVILYGYGGFGIPLSPEFRLWWSAWVERGGAIALGCFRGGAEYGRAWHDDGRLANKHHTFDDAIACARWLADSGWASPGTVAITGGSNGGLTAAASMIRAPEAFGACVPEVGVLDMLRFHRFTIGWAWTTDYGDPEDPEDFARLLGISPLHTLTEGACYPPTLVTTADRDDRVVPAHSFKFTAAMQRAQGCDNPVLARIDTRAGHGAGTATSKLIDARAGVMAFLEHHLRLDERDPRPDGHGDGGR